MVGQIKHVKERNKSVVQNIIVEEDETVQVGNAKFTKKKAPLTTA